MEPSVHHWFNLIAFIGIVIWAFDRKRKARFCLENTLMVAPAWWSANPRPFFMRCKLWIIWKVLKWDLAADRAILRRQSWNPRTSLLAMDQIHKMADWKNWLKGVVDGRLSDPPLLVTGSAWMETWRQSGNSLAFLRKARARSIVALC